MIEIQNKLTHLFRFRRGQPWTPIGVKSRADTPSSRSSLRLNAITEPSTGKRAADSNDVNYGQRKSPALPPRRAIGFSPASEKSPSQAIERIQATKAPSDNFPWSGPRLDTRAFGVVRHARQVAARPSF